MLGLRRSPRRGSPIDAFEEFVSIAHLLPHHHLEIDLVLIEAEERRRHSPDGPWRRRGWTIEERRLVDVVDTLPIRSVADLAAFIPPGLPARFTTADLAAQLGRARRMAQQMAYCLRLVDVIVPVGKRGHAVEYRLDPTRPVRTSRPPRPEAVGGSVP